MLRFGMIGAGSISARHLKVLDRNPRAQLSAIADLDRDRACSAAQPFGAAVYTDYRRMLEKETLDAVIINLPHYLHEESTLGCARKGIHVLLEKPISTSVSSCRRMTEICREHRVVLQVGHIQRYFPENRKAREIIISRALGDLLMIQDTRTSFYFSPDRPRWFLDKKLAGGGILMNLGAHSIDKLKFLTDSHFTEITGSCGFGKPDASVEGNAQVFLKTDRGVTASVTLWGYHHIPLNETTLYFTGGVLKLHTGKNLEIWKEGAFQELAGTDPLLPFEDQLEAFVQAILEGKAPETDGRYAEDIMSVLETIYQKTGERL